MSSYVRTGNLQVADQLFQFINTKVLPGIGLDQEQFWNDFDALIHDLTPINQALLNKREQLQSQIDEWLRNHRESFNPAEYKAFLTDIGYLEQPGEPFQIATTNVDDEIALMAGPQLVVPVNNSRYALNAANARWGSLYDALYGTDAIDESDGADRTEQYNPKRGAQVIAFGRQFLDTAVPLAEGSHCDATKYAVDGETLRVTLVGGQVVTLADQSKFVGFRSHPEEPSAVLLRNHGLHIELQIDRLHPIGEQDLAGVKDIWLEAALTTIMDCEDSIAAVDAEDKTAVYSNWLGLMKGDLSATFNKGSKSIRRSMNPDRDYIAPTGEQKQLPGRSLMLVRNVGHLMTTDAILDKDGQEVPEGIMDAVITSAIAIHDLQGQGHYRNSRRGSIYIVKPKMHGSAETAFAGQLFDRVENMLSLPHNTLKIGVMDEERRTSLNLDNCIRAVKDRIVFINTGFLDRTGDEIHTSMEAGPMVRKNAMKSSVWLQAYERSNVAAGLAAGLPGRAQIGKGMWAMPDRMKDMLEQKIAQPKAGCSTAWVPSPTAAVLHALHYHEVDVWQAQANIKTRTAELLDDILTIPTESNPVWTAEEIQQELDNNAQGILGYVVRWIDQGVGCSKVPDIHNVGLMEDRATLRISSQHIANWLYHGICTEHQVVETMRRMAGVVDAQNANDPLYQPMADNFTDSIAFQAACELVLDGRVQPSGYTEPILHRRRKQYKLQQKAQR